MAEVLSFLGTITIANGGTDGNVLSHNLLGSARRIVIKAPSALTAVCTVKGAPTKNVTLANCQPIRNADLAADYAVVAAKEMHIKDCANLKSIGIVAASAEGADRVFQVYVVHEL